MGTEGGGGQGRSRAAALTRPWELLSTDFERSGVPAKAGGAGATGPGGWRGLGSCWDLGVEMHI